MKQVYFLSIFLFFYFINLNAQTEIASGLEFPNGLALNGNDLYISEYNGNKISRIDITDTTPVVIDVITVSGPGGIVFNGNDLYIAEYDGNKISKIDITSMPPLLTTVVTGINRPDGLLINGNDLYFTENLGNKVSKIDITDFVPTVTTVVEGLNRPAGILINGNDLFIAEDFGDKISKIDISDTIATKTDVVTGLLGPTGIVLYGNELYISESIGNKISKVDITASLPTTLDVVTVNHPFYMIIKNDILYYTETSGSVLTIDLLNPVSLDNIVNETLLITPNPATEFIQIFDLKKKENYKIFDALGNVVKNGVINDENKIDIRGFNIGVYFLKFNNGKTVKFMKNK